MKKEESDSESSEDIEIKPNQYSLMNQVNDIKNKLTKSKKN